MCALTESQDRLPPAPAPLLFTYAETQHTHCSLFLSLTHTDRHGRFENAPPVYVSFTCKRLGGILLDPFAALATW